MYILSHCTTMNPRCSTTIDDILRLGGVSFLFTMWTPMIQGYEQSLSVRRVHAQGIGGTSIICPSTSRDGLIRAVKAWCQTLAEQLRKRPPPLSLNSGRAHGRMNAHVFVPNVNIRFLRTEADALSRKYVFAPQPSSRRR